MAQLKLILLDFDGTLADTRRANTLAYAAALREAGYRLDEADYLARHYGVRCTDFLRSVGIEDPDEIDRIRRRKIELYPSFFETVRLNEPLWNFCRSFRAQGGRVWIVSTGQKANIDHVMHYLGLSEIDLDGIISAHDVAEGKPSPEGFLKAMKAENAAPDQTLIFEDSPAGIEAARRSGASYCIVKL